MRSVARARKALRRRLREWGVGEEAAGTAELLVSELVTNAVKARGAVIPLVGMRCAVVGDRLRLEVQDGSDEQPVVNEKVEEDEECGRGLMLVDVLADGWGVERHVIGKTVWVEVAVEARSLGCFRPSPRLP
ncbi:ATP-binding protein [Streptomyces sp. NPDC048644]|uniref:ATP-binding protein n=1 Tax=Streptomyces sp. NPDC048644 TaxID=3365582 RepID=UPI003717B094